MQQATGDHRSPLRNIEDNPAYFIAVCSQYRAELFGRVVGATCGRPSTELSGFGQIVSNEIELLTCVYSMVEVNRFVIMPNHVHMIIVIHATNNGRPQVAPTISRIMKQWKGAITKRIGFSLWQKSFHDHIIRSEDDYLRLAQYIEDNPAQWGLDSLSHNFFETLNNYSFNMISIY